MHRWKITKIMYLNKFTEWKTIKEIKQQLKKSCHYWTFLSLDTARIGSGFLTPTEMDIW